MFKFEEKDLELIRDYPHYLGHLIGKIKLTELHSDWIRYVWDSDTHTALQGHRGSYKTTSIDIVGTIRWLLFHPSDRIAIIRKPYTEAAKILRTIRYCFELPEIKALFQFAHGFIPKFTQKKESTITFNFKKTNTPEGNIDAYGVGGNITGNHYDKILSDDFIILKDRLSKAERESTKQFIYEIITNIIDPGKQCMFIGTPWHKDDAWTCVPEPIKYSIDDTDILTQEQIDEKRSRIPSALFACNYKLKHVADDKAEFRDPIYDQWNWRINDIVGHIDAKYGGDHYNALTFMGRLPDNRIQAIGWVFEEHVKEKIKWIADKCRKYRVRKIYNEENPDKGYTADLLKKEKLNVSTYHETTNKHNKISSYLKEFWQDLIWANETDDNYLVQITEYYDGAKPDDAPDSAASLLRAAFYEKISKMALYEA